MNDVDKLLGFQRSLAVAHARLLAKSDEAIAAGDLEAADRYAEQAGSIMVAIRAGSRRLAEIVGATAPAATDCADGGPWDAARTRAPRWTP